MAEGLNREQIYGRRVWQLLHSTAAYYPREPTEDDKKHARDFVTIFMEDAIEYPEWTSHVDLASLNVDSNRDFRTWVCT